MVTTRRKMHGVLSAARRTRWWPSPLLWWPALLVAGGCEPAPSPAPQQSSVATTAPPVPVPPSSSALLTAAGKAGPSTTAAALPGPVSKAETCRDLSPPDPKRTTLPFAYKRKLQGFHASTLAPWRALDRAGLRFAFLQASLGLSAAKDFETNWRMAKACKIPRGAFHFLSPKQDAAAQATLFLTQLGDELGELPLVIDAEQTPGCSSPCCERDCRTWEQLIATWIALVHERTQRRPMVYTVRDWWKECLCNTSRFANHPLWLAAYPNVTPTERPGFGGWQAWQFFHYKGNVRFAGGVVDLDLFRSDAGALSTLVSQTTNSSPAP